jgi:rhodanese-related sulfurtransferase
MQTIDREKLQKMREENPDLAVVDVLGSDSYRKYHIPGAINVPLEEDFAEKIRQAVPETDEPVVVYCADEHCQASPKAGKLMEEMGYEQVYDYEAGKEDWRKAGEKVVAGPSPG